MLGGISHWTVGLVATFMAVACTIAADTGAYAFGKTLGRTQLISISPKKTVEGAAGGLLCSTAVALAFWRFLAWPAQARAPHMMALSNEPLQMFIGGKHQHFCPELPIENYMGPLWTSADLPGQKPKALAQGLLRLSRRRCAAALLHGEGSAVVLKRASACMCCAQAGVAVGLAMLIFFASLCGDLIESVMKRDAGLKDAGDLIPGHGGLLDRFDSYIFTGAIVYFILRFVTPLFGL